ncbi:hypothetical protein, partial [uncultured Bradyrhizobium sp.]|uniref:hypothetical protein n=1 Tax=uncultured Bradyrhizobium sp. TaxID=199684 RepID=UPI0035CA4D96
LNRTGQPWHKAGHDGEMCESSRVKPGNDDEMRASGTASPGDPVALLWNTGCPTFAGYDD